VDGQGNFGSVDGDPALGLRYTEPRQTRATVALLVGLEYETVDFIPNYDNSREEPTVLPESPPGETIREILDTGRRLCYRRL